MKVMCTHPVLKINIVCSFCSCTFFKILCFRECISAWKKHFLYLMYQSILRLYIPYPQVNHRKLLEWANSPPPGSKREQTSWPLGNKQMMLKPHPWDFKWTTAKGIVFKWTEYLQQSLPCLTRKFDDQLISTKMTRRWPEVHVLSKK